ncbi:MAG: hypothetical protein ACRBM6_04095 [Geminicoccales bacterium]
MRADLLSFSWGLFVVLSLLLLLGGAPMLGGPASLVLAAEAAAMAPSNELLSLVRSDPVMPVWLERPLLEDVELRLLLSLPLSDLLDLSELLLLLEWLELLDPFELLELLELLELPLAPPTPAILSLLKF